MALPTTAPAAHPSPEVVARAFVEQYYLVFQRFPEQAYKFYQESSILSRPDANGVMTSVTTMQAINELVLSLDSKNYITEIETVDSQPSYNNGVFILVTGCLTGSDGIRRKFAQTFFLYSQGKGLYFVLNDVFRYAVEGRSEDVAQIFVNGDNEEVVKTPTTPDQELDLPQDHEAVEPATTLSDLDHDDNDESQNPSDNGFSIVQDVINTAEPTNSSEAEAPTVPDVAPIVAQEDFSKKSYASIVKVTKGSTPPVSVYVPAATKPKPIAAVPDAPPTTVTKPASAQKPVLSSQPIPPPEALVTSNTESTELPDVEGHSIYIRNLPLNATAQLVEEVFKKFGAIKTGGVQVRNHRIDHFCFGFVEFESLSSMQAAIEASPILISGRQAFVEEKRTTTRVINGVVSVGVGAGGRGRYPLGRGAFRNDFRNDIFRGRGFVPNQGGFVRGGGEFRNRGEYQPRGEYANRGEYVARGRGRVQGQGGRPIETYQQRTVQGGNPRVNRSNGVNQVAVSA